MRSEKKQNPWEQSLFASPLERNFWRSAKTEMRTTKKMTAMALLCALCGIIDVFFIPVGGEFLRIQFSFLVMSVAAMAGGPIYAIPAGFLIDILSFLLSGDPAGYFPGYALSSMLSFTFFALFFYHAKKLSFSRIFLAKLCVSVFVNVLVGCIWRHMLYGKAYMVYFVSAAIKNITLLPIEAILLTVVFGKLLPVLKKAKLIPQGMEVSVQRRDVVISVIGGIAGIAVLYAYYVFKTRGA